MARIPDEFIDSLLDKIDIVDVIGEYVSLKKSGGNKYVGLCPFHNEKTASFSVDGDKQLFYCFGCHVGGNLIGFLEKKENLTFYETLEELARRANVALPVGQNDGEKSISRDTRAKILEANKEAARYYYHILQSPEGAEGMAYFHERGVTGNIINRFGLGYATDSRSDLIHYLKDKGYDEELLVLAGLAVKNDFGVRDTFRNRVMFPIIAPTGDVIAFGGRVLDHSKPKYLNTNDTPVFNKRKNLYALNILKKHNRGIAIIGEGYMDVIGLNMAGFDYGVASLGTAVTPEQVRLLKRYAKEIYICYDGDQAGISATHKVIDLMKAEELKPHIISLPLGVDPDEYIKAYGAESFAEMMKQARSSIEYLLDEVKEQCDMNGEEGRASYAQQAVAIVEKYAFDSIETEMYFKRIHAESGFSMDALYDKMEKKPVRKNAPQTVSVSQGLVHKFDDVTERALISVLTEYPTLLAQAKEKIKSDYFASAAYQRIFDEMCRDEGKTSLNALMRVFEGDEDALAALSAVGIENTVFGDPNAYLEDCCLKMHMDHLQRKRDELRQKMAQTALAEEQIALAGEITVLEREIKALQSAF